MLENPLKILIEKQLCSTNVQPPFSKKQIILATNPIKRQQSKNPLKNFHIDADWFQFMLKCFKSKILDNQLKYFKTKQWLRSTNLHPPFFPK